MNNLEIILRGKEIKKAISNLPQKGLFGEELISNKGRSVIVSRVITEEEVSSKAEIHEDYTDIFIIKEGKEELFVGGKILNKELTGSGEWRGSVLRGAKKYFVSSGDVAIIPNGVAHRHGKGKIKMLVIKVKFFVV